MEQAFIALDSLNKEVGANEFIHILPVPVEAPPIELSLEFLNKQFNGSPTAAYPYHTADGGVFAYMVRWDIQQADGAFKKETRPFIYAEEKSGERHWKCKGPQLECLPYNLHEITSRPEVPILVVEGEKTAEAAKLLFPELVVTTTLFGALAPHKTDWSAMKGRNIIISPDFDDAGIKYGDAVCNLCKKAGAKSIDLLSLEKIAKKLFGKTSLPPKYDIADAVKDGLSKDALEASETAFDDLLSPYFTQIEIQSMSLPKDFRLNERGDVEYYYEKKNNKGEVIEEGWRWLCTHLVATHKIRDRKSKGWSRVLSLRDSDGVHKQVVVPMSVIYGDMKALKEILSFEGVEMSPNNINRLVSYLSFSCARKRALAVDRTGWHGQSYVLAEDLIYGGSPKEEIIFDTLLSSSSYQKAGTLKDWQDTIGKWTVGNSRLQFSILAALAAPVLDALGEDNFGIHFVGGSSIGKTTALRIASSVWGKEIKSWRTTDNAAESLARGCNDGLLMLDELSQVSGEAADAMIYMLGNGSGKARSNKQGDARPIATFRLVFLSSGEVGLETKISEGSGKKKIKAGQTVRFIEIPADAGQGMGIFDTIHNFENPVDFAVELKDLTKKYQGTVIDRWLKFLTQNLEYHVSQIQKLRKIWLEENPLEKAVDGQVERVKNKIALLAAVGEHASSKELQLLPWNRGEAFSCCSKIFNAWLNQRGGIGAFEVNQTIDRLVHFINEHGSSRFENAWEEEDRSNFIEQEWREDNPGQVDSEAKKAENRKRASMSRRSEKVINRAGFRRLIKDNQTYYFEPLAFDKEILQGGDKKTLLEALASKGVFVMAPEKAKDGAEKTRYTVSVRVLGFGQKRLYQISNQMLEKFSDSAL